MCLAGPFASVLHTLCVSIHSLFLYFNMCSIVSAIHSHLIMTVRFTL